MYACCEKGLPADGICWWEAELLQQVVWWLADKFKFKFKFTKATKARTWARADSESELKRFERLRWTDVLDSRCDGDPDGI